MKDSTPDLWNQSAPRDGGVGARIVAWAREHALLFRESFEHITRNLIASLLAWTLIGIALSLPLGLYLIQTGLQLVTGPWSTSPGITLYLEPGIATTRVTALQSLLEEDVRIESAIHVSPDAALDQFSELIGLDSLIEDLTSNPLPGAFDLVPAPGLFASDMARLVEELESIEEVRDVVSEGLWLNRVLALSELVGRLSLILAVLFGVGALLVTASSVRLVIESRLAELQVMSLVGATPRFMRRPFIYFGVLYGLGGGFVATMLISIGILVLREPALEFLGSYGVDVSTLGFDSSLVALILVVAALIGAIGAQGACRRRLKSLEM